MFFVFCLLLFKNLVKINIPRIKCAKVRRKRQCEGYDLYFATNGFSQHNKGEDPKHSVGDVVKDKHGDAFAERRPCVIDHDPPTVDDIPNTKADADQKEEQNSQAQLRRAIMIDDQCGGCGTGGTSSGAL